jgi:hypothetical protein
VKLVRGRYKERVDGVVYALKLLAVLSVDTMWNRVVSDCMRGEGFG